MTKCRDCLLDKEDRQFTVDRKRPNGKDVRCKDCKKTRKDNWYYGGPKVSHEDRKRQHAAMVGIKERKCSARGGCGEIKSRDYFSPDPRQPGGLQSRCKQCSANWQNANPSFRRNGWLRAKYGISSDDYDKMLSSQGGKCAICGSKSPRRRGQVFMSVDHDHRTGKVRGLLCSTCNTSIGHAGDSPVLLRYAAAYLDNHSGYVENTSNVTAGLLF